MAKFMELIYEQKTRQNVVIPNPDGAMATSDYGKLVGLSSAGVALLTTLTSGVGTGFTLHQAGILRALPNGVTTAGSTQYVLYTPLAVGDVLRCRVSSDLSTSGSTTAPYSSNAGVSVGFNANGPHFPTLTTAGSLLTQGGVQGVLVGFPSTKYVDVMLTGIQTIKLTTA